MAQKGPKIYPEESDTTIRGGKILIVLSEKALYRLLYPLIRTVQHMSVLQKGVYESIRF